MPTNNINYTLDGFNDFINEVKKMSSDYDYVVVRGRRCFNIIARWLPKVDFITFPALLSKYKELVNSHFYIDDVLNVLDFSLFCFFCHLRYKLRCLQTLVVKLPLR